MVDTFFFVYYHIHIIIIIKKEGYEWLVLQK